jgi:hypothetical protein
MMRGARLDLVVNQPQHGKLLRLPLEMNSRYSYDHHDRAVQIMTSPAKSHRCEKQCNNTMMNMPLCCGGCGC